MDEVGVNKLPVYYKKMGFWCQEEDRRHHHYQMVKTIWLEMVAASATASAIRRGLPPLPTMADFQKIAETTTITGRGSSWGWILQIDQITRSRMVV